LFISGVSPRFGTRETGANPDARVGLGDGLREDGLEGMPKRDFPVTAIPAVELAEGVRLCDDGKLLILLWIMGDGPRSPAISEAPFLLGRVGLRATTDGVV
jgi:hypothetical protein